MTETCSADTGVEVIEADTTSGTADLNRPADAILAGSDHDASGIRPLQQAVRENADLVRQWGRDRTARLRGAVEAEPVKATLHALAIGVLIGMLAGR